MATVLRPKPATTGAILICDGIAWKKPQEQ